MPDPVWSSPATQRLLDLALEEDIGRGDVTTAAVVGPDAVAEGDIVAREPVVVAGLPLAAQVFRRVDPAIVFTAALADGDAAAKGAVLAQVRGPAAGVLVAERTALNFLQRLSGVATLTRAFVAAAGGRLRIADTRKTTPGARAIEKHAVRLGGGVNHRFDLGSGVLIKDNHIAVAGSVREAVGRARARAPHPLKIEVEVDTLAQLDEALDAGADIVLLDNFGTPEIHEAVRRVRARAPGTLVEISGGVRLERIGELAATGADLVSVVALTHSARAVDLSLDVRLGAP